MKAGELIDALERFFLDIIGQIVPGACFLAGLSMLVDSSWSAQISVFGEKLGSARWIAAVALAYVAGHGVTSVGDAVIVPVANTIIKLLAWFRLTLLIPSTFYSRAKLFERIARDPVFIAFTEEARSALPSLATARSEAVSITSWRNIAMSFASGERNTVWRFMFISLLNQGIATVVVLLAILHTGLTWANVPHAALSVPLWVVWLISLAVAFFFLERRHVFFRISMEVPFSMALVELAKDKRGKQAPSVSPGSLASEPPGIYLAGGFQSGWQDKVVSQLRGFRIFDPRLHRLAEGEQYTVWDLQAISRSSWIFAYLEASNPGGYSLALEVGYAKALGKRILLLNEKASSDTNHYLSMLDAAADVRVSNLDDGIAFLLKLRPILE